MRTDFAKLIVQADTTDLKQLKTRLSDVERQSIRTDKSNVGLTNSFKKLAISIGGVVTITKTISFLKDATFAASDLSEELNKASVVLGGSFQAVNKFAENAATSIGQSQKEALEAASTFGIFGKSAGLAGDDLGDFSIKFTKLSSDLASFYNTKPEDAVRAISSALRGENEAIRRYGVLLDATSLQQQAFKMGIIDSTKDALTPQQKVLAASELIMKQTTDAQGDFARNSDELANSTKILNAQLEDLNANIGDSLLPATRRIVSILSKQMVPALKEVAIGWGWILGDKKEHEEKLKKLNIIGNEIKELTGLQKEWKNVEQTQLALKAQKGSLFSPDTLKEAQNNLSTIKGMISDLNKESQKIVNPLSGMTGETGTGTNKKQIDKTKELEAAAKKEAEALKRLNDLMTEGERIRVANLNPMEKLYEEHKKLGELLDAEAISWTTYDRALKSLEEQHEAYLQSEIDFMTRKEELRQQERDSLYNGLLTQEEEINQFYNRKRELILESEAITEAQRQDLLVRLRKDTDNKLLALQEKSNTSNLKSYETMFDGIMRATSAFGKEQSGFYKTMFVLRQSAALANSLVAIGQGLAESSKIGWPQNMATMAGHIASTAGIIASISSVKFSGKFANGGEIPAGSWGIAGEAGKPEMIQGPAKVISGDDTEEILNRRSGETVINFYDSSGTLVDTFRNKVRSQEFDTVIDDIALRMKERA